MNKKNLVLGGILVILIIFAYLYQGPIKKWKANSNKPDNFLAKINVDQINKIEIIKNNENKIVLEKNGDRWKIAETKDFYVPKNTAKTMIENLKKAVESDLEIVSDNADMKKEFKTDDDNGIKIKIVQDNSDIIEFIIGKHGNNYKSSYISEQENQKTYLVNSNLNSVFSRDDWYDKTIFSIDKTKISKVRFQYPNRNFVVEKSVVEDKDEWNGISPYKFKVDNEKILEVIDSLSDLEAIKIPEQKFEGTGLEKNLIIIQITGEGIDNTIMIGDSNGDKENELFYAKKASSDNIYLITKEQRNKLDKNIKDFE